MILLNFSHPLTPPQIAQLETLTQQRVERLIEQMPQFDHALPFAEQARALVDAIGLTPAEWQSAPLVVVPPALNFIAVVLLAELHGRMGYFPAVARLRPVSDMSPSHPSAPLRTGFEVAEVMNLQGAREAARLRR